MQLGPPAYLAYYTFPSCTNKTGTFREPHAVAVRWALGGSSLNLSVPALHLAKSADARITDDSIASFRQRLRRRQQSSPPLSCLAGRVRNHYHHHGLLRQGVTGLPELPNSTNKGAL